MNSTFHIGFQRKREGSASDDGAVSDGGEDDNDVHEKKENGTLTCK